MEVLIPLAVVAVVIAWSIERFKPELWNKIVAKLLRILELSRLVLNTAMRKGIE